MTTLTFTETYPHGVDAAIRDSTPGYADACRAVDLLAKLEAPTGGGGSPYMATEISSRLLARALADDLTAQDALTITRDTIAEYSETEATSKAISDARAAAKQHRDNLVGLDAYLTGYAEAFEVLLADLRTLRPLKQILTAEAAIAADRLEDYQRVSDLFAAHQGLRARHFKLLRDHLYNNLELPEAAVFVDVHSFFPHWAPWRTGDSTLITRNGREHTQPVRVPWPTQQHGAAARREFERVAATTEFLVWAVETPTVRLWMPALASFEKAQVKLRSARAIDARQEFDDGKSEYMDPVLKPRPRSSSRLAG